MGDFFLVIIKKIFLILSLNNLIVRWNKNHLKIYLMLLKNEYPHPLKNPSIWIIFLLNMNTKTIHFPFLSINQYHQVLLQESLSISLYFLFLSFLRKVTKLWRTYLLLHFPSFMAWSPKTLKPFSLTLTYYVEVMTIQLMPTKWSCFLLPSKKLLWDGSWVGCQCCRRLT